MTKTKPEELSPIHRLEMMTKNQQARKLRLTLEKVRAKTAAGLNLSIEEEILLAECRRRYHSRPQTVSVIDESGVMRIKHTVDVEPLMQAMKDYGDVINRQHQKVSNAGTRLVGSVDPLIAAVWASETGLRIGTAEFAAYAIKKLESNEWSKFRVGH